MIERVYTINLSRLYAAGRHTERARKAVKIVGQFASRHMKTEGEKVVITKEVNEYIWRNGIQKPPRRLRLKMMKDKDGTVMVMLEKEDKGAEKKVVKEKEKPQEKRGNGKKKSVEVEKKEDEGKGKINRKGQG